MKRVVLMSLVLATLLAVAAQAQPYTGCCTNTTQGISYPAGSVTMFGTLDEHGCVLESHDTWSPEPCPAATPAPTVVPTPTPAAPPDAGGWWELVKAWADKFVIWQWDAASLAKILALLASFMGIVQTVKKLLETASKWEWLLKLVPGLATVFDWMAHGIGPLILNGLITGGTLLGAAIADGALTAGELIAIVGAVVGTDVLYRLVRGVLFPKAT